MLCSLKLMSSLGEGQENSVSWLQVGFPTLQPLLKAESLFLSYDNLDHSSQDVSLFDVLVRMDVRISNSRLSLVGD